MGTTLKNLKFILYFSKYYDKIIDIVKKERHCEIGGKTMEVLKYILVVLDLIVCFVLTVLCLIQSKDDEGLSGTITGSSTGNFYEKNKGKTKQGRMKRATIISAVAFMVLTIATSIVYVI